MPVFEIYRSLHNDSHYVAVLEGDRSPNAESVRMSQNLVYETRIEDDSRRHLGFDPGAAKAAIRDRGFHAFAITIAPRDHFD